MTDTSVQEQAYGLYTEVDIENETLNAQNFFAEFLKAGRIPNPRVTFYLHEDPILTVSLPPTDNADDEAKAFMQAMYLQPALRSTTTMIALHSVVATQDGDSVPAVVVVVMNRSGVVSRAHLYRVDDGEITYHQDVELDQTHLMYPKAIEMMMPVFVMARNSALSAAELVEWLSARGHEVQFHGEWTYGTISV